MVATSAASGARAVGGLLAMLNDTDNQLRAFSLKKLLTLVDVAWAQISDELHTLEALSEEKDFEGAQDAALLASRLLFHLGEMDQATGFALRAGNSFDVTGDSAFEHAILANCVDSYSTLRRRVLRESIMNVDDEATSALESQGAITPVFASSSGLPTSPSAQNSSLHTALSGALSPLARAEADGMDPRLVEVVERLIKESVKVGDVRAAIGVAIHTRREDFIKMALEAAEPSALHDLLDHTFSVCYSHLENRDFRHHVYHVLLELHMAAPVVDQVSVARLAVFLNRTSVVSAVLGELMDSCGEEENSEAAQTAILTALQISFDICENATQLFIRALVGELDVAPKTQEADKGVAVVNPRGPGFPMHEVDHLSSPEQLLLRVHDVLSGTVSAQLMLEFMYSNCNSDQLILSRCKTAALGSMQRSAVVTANAFMHSGTMVDTFLRDNFKWLGTLMNWAKFNTVASYGVIHHGQLQQGRNMLASFLPKRAASGSPYDEGGALYAYGLATAGNGTHDVTKNGSEETAADYLSSQITAAGEKEPVLHGGCLGLGLSAMGTSDFGHYETLLEVLSRNQAVSGEAAGIGIGLVMAGSGSARVFEEVIGTTGAPGPAMETEHEKIVRGCAVGAALIGYGREESADAQIDVLAGHADPVLRYGGMLAIGMAYAGTASEAALRRLLSVAVSDTSSDVRRMAVTATGFILHGVEGRTPRLVALLSESFNPHVRYGSAMAVGIACASTGSRDALNLLKPLVKDPEPFVRQAAYIALGMVFNQCNNSVVQEVLLDVATARREQELARAGAMHGLGILNAGGRNAAIALSSPSGNMSARTMIGIALYLHTWYWTPMASCLTLAFTPTAAIALQKDLKMPVMEYTSHAPASKFAYPEFLALPEDLAKKVTKKAVLSTSKKAARRHRASRATLSTTTSSVDMEMDGGASSTTAGPSDEDKDKEGEKAEVVPEESEEEKEKAAEAAKKAQTDKTHSVLSNPSRVTLQQMKVIKFDRSSRFVPITAKKLRFGVVMVKDCNPEEELQVVDSKASEGAEAAMVPAYIGGQDDQYKDERDPPSDFEFFTDVEDQEEEEETDEVIAADSKDPQEEEEDIADVPEPEAEAEADVEEEEDAPME